MHVVNTNTPMNTSHSVIISKALRARVYYIAIIGVVIPADGQLMMQSIFIFMIS